MNTINMPKPFVKVIENLTESQIQAYFKILEEAVRTHNAEQKRFICVSNDEIQENYFLLTQKLITVKQGTEDFVEVYVSGLFSQTSEETQEYKDYVKRFNQIVVGKKCRGDKKSAGYFNQRIKKYSMDDLIHVVHVIFEDDWHISIDHGPVTPEYCLRETIVEKYLNHKRKTVQKKPTNAIFTGN